MDDDISSQTKLTPKVSVIIPVFNGEKCIEQAINSIFNQTYQDFDLTVIDDGSTDGTSEILNHYKSRIRVISQSNQGPAIARNTGIKASTGQYIAFLDADDISLPNRLEQQVRFLDERQQIRMIGSSAEVIDENNHFLGFLRVPKDDIDIRWTCLLLNPFIQSTVMLRREFFVANNIYYNPDPMLRGLEDYELWSRYLARTQSANLTKPLIRYRVRKDSLTIDVRQNKLEIHSKIALSTIDRMLERNVMTIDQIKPLCSFLLANPRSYAGFGAKRSIILERYIDLWDIFSSQYHEFPNFNPLQRKVALKIARLLLFPYPPQGWTRIASRLFTLEKIWPLWFFLSFPAAIIRLFYWYKISSNR